MTINIISHPNTHEPLTRERKDDTTINECLTIWFARGRSNPTAGGNQAQPRSALQELEDFQISRSKLKEHTVGNSPQKKREQEVTQHPLRLSAATRRVVRE